MTIETKANKQFNGKTNKEQPVKAVISGDNDYLMDGETIATGKTATEAKANAMADLLDAWKWNSQYPEVRFANDGSVFVGRQTAQDRVEYTRYQRNEDGATRSCGGSVSGPYIYNELYDKRLVGIRTYMDHVVNRYNEATA
jgi:hypothetical protein